MKTQRKLFETELPRRKETGKRLTPEDLAHVLGGSELTPSLFTNGYGDDVFQLFGSRKGGTYY